MWAVIAVQGLAGNSEENCSKVTEYLKVCL